MQLKTNLATKTYINNRQFNLSAAAVVCLLVAMLFLNVRDIATTAGETARVARELAVLEGKFRGEKGVTEKDYQALLAKIRFANSIIYKKSFSWLVLLDRLESIVPDGIALTMIDPEPKDGGLKLTGSARSFSNMRSFMENLEGSKVFTDVFLVNQSQAKISESQKGLIFNIMCKADYK